jgi:hypothetical protein
MKVAAPIEQYLGHLGKRGLEPRSIRTTGHAVRTVLEQQLGGNVEALGAAGVGEALLTALGKRTSKNTKRPLTECTRELYLNAAKAFLIWCISQGWLRANPLGQIPARAAAAPKVPAPPHIGEMSRNLREAAGLTRQQFEAQTGLSSTTLKGIDLGYHKPTAEQVRKLLLHPSMARLPAMAAAAGLELPTGADGVEGGKP